MRKYVFALALGVLLCVLPAFAVPYLHVQAYATFTPGPPGAKTFALDVHLLNTGDMAASCTVTAGGQKKVTGVSPNGGAAVVFDSLTYYRGYTVACSVN